MIHNITSKAMDGLFRQGDPWLVASQRPLAKPPCLRMPPRGSAQLIRILLVQDRTAESGGGEGSTRLRLQSYESKHLNA